VAVVEVRNNDRSAEGAAEVVADQLRLGVGAERDGIEGGVLVILKGAAMQLVGAGLGDGGNFARLTELGVVEHAIHAQLLDRLAGDEGIGERCVRCCALRRNAVDRDLCLKRQTTLYRELGAGAVIGGGIRLHAGQRLDERDRAGAACGGAIVGRQLLHIRRVKSGRDRGCFGLDVAGRRGIDGDLLAHTAGGELGIGAELLAGIQLQVFEVNALKTFGIHMHAVNAGNQVERTVLARGIRLRGKGDACTRVSDAHRGIRHRRPCRVCNGAGDEPLRGLCHSARKSHARDGSDGGACCSISAEKGHSYLLKVLLLPAACTRRHA
jgi:hypothetical protein